MGNTIAGALSCCVLKPPACEAIDYVSYTSCYNNPLCYGDWASYGSCTGCGTNGTQTQVQPCNGKTGAANTRTIIATCGLMCTHELPYHHNLNLGVSSSWSWSGSWSTCSPTCGTGTGTQTRTQTCTGTCSDGTCTLGATKSISQSCSNCSFAFIYNSSFHIFDPASLISCRWVLGILVWLVSLLANLRHRNRLPVKHPDLPRHLRVSYVYTRNHKHNKSALLKWSVLSAHF